MVSSAWWKVNEADHPASIRNSGPYGAGVLAHNGSTPTLYGPEPMVPGPYWYGLMWWLIISPCAA